MCGRVRSRGATEKRGGRRPEPGPGVGRVAAGGLGDPHPRPLRTGLPSEAAGPGTQSPNVGPQRRPWERGSGGGQAPWGLLCRPGPPSPAAPGPRRRPPAAVLSLPTGVLEQLRSMVDDSEDTAPGLQPV